MPTRVDPRQELSCETPDLAPRPPGTFEVLARDPDSPARAGRLWTAHGPIDTPCFMPVGTYGAVKGLDSDDLREVGSQIILGNSYHLGHRPGAARVAALGGLHRMMAWDRPILTDSGGFQVFSLRGLQKIDDACRVDRQDLARRAVVEHEAVLWLGPGQQRHRQQCRGGEAAAHESFWHVISLCRNLEIKELLVVEAPVVPC